VSDTDEGIVWELEVWAAQPGPDYGALFEVPVLEPGCDLGR
jgi:hypothetical protein